MTEPNNKIIDLKNVSYSDGDVAIIKDISGTITKGKITTIVGPSGAGKTTLFRLINGLINPTKGDIIINGKKTNSYEPTDLRRHVGLALQSAPMLSGTVYTNIALPKTLQGTSVSRNEALHYLTTVGLEAEILDRDVKDLSGGQKQRVSIARTLVNQPEILLLDEITSSLDRISKQEIEDLIQTINQEYDVTVLWITHQIEQAIQIGDETWVLMDGKLIESGPSSLLENPDNKLVKRFLEGEFA